MASAKQANEEKQALFGRFENTVRATVGSHEQYASKPLFGGLCLWVGGSAAEGGSMIGGVTKKQEILLRTSPELAAELTSMGFHSMMPTKNMPYYLVDQGVFFENEERTARWIKVALEAARSGPKKAKKPKEPKARGDKRKGDDGKGSNKAPRKTTAHIVHPAAEEEDVGAEEEED